MSNTASKQVEAGWNIEGNGQKGSAGKMGRMPVMKSLVSIAVAIAASSAFAAVSYAAPGELDPTFGDRGRVATQLPNQTKGLVTDLKLGTDHLVLSGGGEPGGDGFFARYSADGAIDNSFGQGGITTIPDSSWTRVEPLPDGGVVGFGRIGSKATIVRLQNDGSLDTSFGNAGVVQPDVASAFDPTNDITRFGGGGIDAEGRIVGILSAGGCAVNADPADTVCRPLALYRFNPDGSPDPSFGGDGLVTAQPSSDDMEMVVAKDGSFLVAEVSARDGDEFTPSYRDLYVWRYKPDGKLMSEFGQNGLVTVEDEDVFSNFGWREVSGASVTSTGEVTVTIGDTVMRFLANGEFDSSYSGDGRSTFGESLIQETSNVNIALEGSGVSPDGTVFMTSASSPRRGTGQPPAIPTALRLNRSGQPDATFANDGLAVARVDRQRNGSEQSEPESRGAPFVFSENGSVTVAVSSRVNGQPGVSIVRFQGGKIPRLSCQGRPATVQGTQSADKLIAGTVTVSGGGNDMIRKPQGYICSGAGDDVFDEYGQGGFIFAGTGDDVMLGDDSTSSVHAGPGNDRVAGAEVEGGPGNDTIAGSGSLRGGAGNDRITGDSRNDEIFGGRGRDVLSGKGLDDLLRGGPGNDRLMGGTGTDRLYGNAGRDRLNPGPSGPRYHVYRLRRKDLRMNFRIIGKRIVDAGATTLLECSNGRKDRYFGGTLAWPSRPKKFDSQTGAFQAVSEIYDGDGGYADEMILKGRVSPRVIEGKIRASISEFGINVADYKCLSGKPGKRWVKFRATRRPDPVQIVRQGG